MLETGRVPGAEGAPVLALEELTFWVRCLLGSGPPCTSWVGCKDLSHTPQSPWEPFVPGWVCSYTAWRCLSSPTGLLWAAS